MPDNICSNCGMALAPNELLCSKCDSHRYAKNRGCVLVVDIAHDRQRLVEAETQLDAAINLASEQCFGKLKVIVGRGLIRQEIRLSLDTAQWQNRIRTYQLENNNEGAYILEMPKSL